MSTDFQDVLNPGNFWARIRRVETAARLMTVDPNQDAYSTVAPHQHAYYQVTGVARAGLLGFWASGLGSAGSRVPWQGTWDEAPPLPLDGHVVALSVVARIAPGTGYAEGFYLVVNGSRTGDVVALVEGATSATASVDYTFQAGDVLAIERDAYGSYTYGSATDVRLLIAVE